MRDGEGLAEWEGLEQEMRYGRAGLSAAVGAVAAAARVTICMVLLSTATAATLVGQEPVKAMERVAPDSSMRDLRDLARAMAWRPGDQVREMPDLVRSEPFNLQFSLGAFSKEVLPEGWSPAGATPRAYTMGVDPEVFRTKSASLWIGSRDDAKQIEFGAAAQFVQADTYRGKRLRLTGYVKTQDVDEGWAGLWMRVEGRVAMLGFDNMADRPVRGTSDWMKCMLVLDIPDDAFRIAFGALLVGRGQAWIDDITFESVGDEVPSTNLLLPPP